MVETNDNTIEGMSHNLNQSVWFISELGRLQKIMIFYIFQWIEKLVLILY